MRKERAKSRQSRGYRLIACVAVLSFATLLTAQETSSVVPTLVNFSGSLSDASGKPITSIVGITFYLYQNSQGGTPLWMETQNITPDKFGHYTVTLGSTTSQGLPASLFASGEARWLGVQAQGQEEQPRVMLLAVPYALKAGDAQTIGGLPASAFVLAAPTTGGGGGTTTGAASGGSSGAQKASANPDLGGTGTADFVPLWTDSSGDLGNSVLFQSGTGSTAKIGINTTTPVSTLDVKGGSTVRGTLQLPPTGTATATAGFNSQALDWQASAFNSGTGKALNQTFQWQAEAAGNDTTTPTGTLNLLFGSGTAKPAETGLKLSNKGVFTFATGQTFPGTGTITGVTAGTDLTGGGTNGKVTLSLNTAATDARYAQLGVSNSFTGNETVTGNITSSGTVQGGQGFFANSTGAAPVEAIENDTTRLDNAIAGIVYSPQNGSAGVVGTALATTGQVFGVEGTAQATFAVGVYGVDGAQSAVGAQSVGSGVWGDAGNLGQQGVLATADNTFAAVAANNSAGFPAVLAENDNTTALALGLEGYTSSPTGIGIYGDGLVESSTFATHAGFQPIGTVGDAGDNSDGGGPPVGIWGAADSGFAIVGESSGGNPTEYLYNSTILGTVFQAGGGFGSCTIDTTGTFVCHGLLASSVPRSDQRWSQLYAVQSPENWFEDFGSGELAGGTATIALDPDFLETVNASDYHVFLTANGDCKGLYVASKSPNGFVVRELGGGRSGIAFDYRIVAKRKGYENVRMADVTESHNRAAAVQQQFARTNDPRTRPRMRSPMSHRVLTRASAVPALPTKPNTAGR